MTLLELISMLRGHVVKLIIVALACGVVGFAGGTVYNIVKPSYTATAYLTTVGGSFSSASGLADGVAADASTDGTAVAAELTSSKNRISFTATGNSGDACIYAVNSAANKLSSQAKKKKAVSSANVVEATSASSKAKSPMLYGIAGFFMGLFGYIALAAASDMFAGRIRSTRAVEELGVPCLGKIASNEDANTNNNQILIANLKFAGQPKGSAARSVCIVPAGKKVNARVAYGILQSVGVANKPSMVVVPALSTSVDIVYRGRAADSTIIVVEEGVSTLEDVSSLVHELKVSGVTLAGFIYLVESKKSSKEKGKENSAAKHVRSEDCRNSASAANAPTHLKGKSMDQSPNSR